jgi:hypothetical protein
METTDLQKFGSKVIHGFDGIGKTWHLAIEQKNQGDLVFEVKTTGGTSITIPVKRNALISITNGDDAGLLGLSLTFQEPSSNGLRLVPAELSRDQQEAKHV